MGFSRKYDRAITESEDGKRLYAYWYQKVNKNTDCQEFATYPGFYNWAMENGYTVGAKLFRRDPKGPFNPDNCVWIYAKEKTIHSYDTDFAKKWDEAVNRIRRYYGMEPIHSSEV